MIARGGHVAVIGAGIVGLSTAIWLQQFGCRVTLVDRKGPGAGASFGNGGVLADLAVVPVATPGIWKTAPRMLADPDGPLFLRWRYAPRLLPFLRPYLAAARADRVEKTADALQILLHDARQQHQALARLAGAEAFIGAADYLYVYRDRAAYDADAYGWDLRRRRGYAVAPLDADGLAAFDPALKGRFGFGVRSRTSGVIRDPGAYVAALHAHFLAAGGQDATRAVTGFDSDAGRALRARSQGAPLAADAFVVTAGAWSGPLAQALGVRVRLESERGYHIDFHDPSLSPRAPIMIAASKFVLTPMAGRLRAAGVVEFGGLDAPAARAPFALLRRQVARHFPDLEYARTTEWMGHRPATADSVPVIGQSPRLSNVYLGYGHHHVGLTGGPKTGRWIAQMITGRAPNADLSAFSPSRRPT
ncbi:MAG: FAD-dependent oxidoreductase [Pseudomonadota bacterium]